MKALGFCPHQGIILFNVYECPEEYVEEAEERFPSPSGDYLI